VGYHNNKGTMSTLNVGFSENYQKISFGKCKKYMMIMMMMMIKKLDKIKILNIYDFSVKNLPLLVGILLENCNF